MTRWKGRCGRLGRPAQLVRLAAHRPGARDSWPWPGTRCHRSDRRLVGHHAARGRRRSGSSGRSGLPTWNRASPSSNGPEAGTRRGGRPERLGAVVLSVPAPFQPGAGAPTSGAGDERSLRTWLAGDPLPELAERFGVPVVVENNANLAALGEYLAGAVPGRSDVVDLRVAGSWVGAGLVLGGRVHRGAVGFAGELGHIHVDDDGPLCRCGGRGCLVSPDRASARRRRRALRPPVGHAGPAATGRCRRAGSGAGARGPRPADRPAAGGPVHRAQSRTRWSSAVRIGASSDLVAAGVREQIDRYAPPWFAPSVTTVTSTLGVRGGVARRRRCGAGTRRPAHTAS